MSRAEPIRRALKAHNEGDLVRFGSRQLIEYDGKFTANVPPALVENLRLDENHSFDIWLKKSGNRVVLDFEEPVEG